jgi:hypothetical protein
VGPDSGNAHGPSVLLFRSQGLLLHMIRSPALFCRRDIHTDKVASKPDSNFSMAILASIVVCFLKENVVSKVAT